MKLQSFYFVFSKTKLADTVPCINFWNCIMFGKDFVITTGNVSVKEAYMPDVSCAVRIIFEGHSIP